MFPLGPYFDVPAIARDIGDVSLYWRDARGRKKNMSAFAEDDAIEVFGDEVEDLTVNVGFFEPVRSFRRGRVLHARGGG